MDNDIPWAGLIPVGVLCLGFVAYCIVDVVRHDVKHLPKWAWIVISCVQIPLGGLAYLLLGRDSNR